MSSGKSHSEFNFKFQIPATNFLKFFFFLMWTIFLKSLLNLLQYCFWLLCFFQPQGMWPHSSPTRSQTHTPCIGRRSLNHWATREVLRLIVSPCLKAWRTFLSTQSVCPSPRLHTLLNSRQVLYPWRWP